jgi:hypothetical protein
MLDALRSLFEETTRGHCPLDQGTHSFDQFQRALLLAHKEKWDEAMSITGRNSQA